MRFARVIGIHDQYIRSLDHLVETSDLDVLQLDYVWHKGQPAKPTFATGFLAQLSTLHKSLYLDPKLHVISNAGAGNQLGCIEAIAQYLCEHDDAQLALSVVRGENLLPAWEDLLAAGVELKDCNTGTPLTDVADHLISATVELGAGPYAMALDEGARIVIGGCYDFAAPAIGGAVSARILSWEQQDKLAQLAAAAHLSDVVIEFDAAGQLALHIPRSETMDLELFQRQLRYAADENGELQHADVILQLGNIQLRETSPRMLNLSGVTGLATSDHWLLQVTYETGFAAILWFSCCKTTDTEAVQAVLQNCCPQDAVQGSVTVERYLNAASPEEELLKATIRTPDKIQCEAHIDEVLRSALQSTIPGCCLAEPYPICHRETAQLHCRVPRDAIAVSVDTRRASEWR